MTRLAVNWLSSCEAWLNSGVYEPALQGAAPRLRTCAGGVTMAGALAHEEATDEPQYYRHAS